MAIPEKPLEVDLDVNKMTLGEAVIFDADMFSLGKFRKFLIKHSNWTEEEIDAITLEELKQVAEQLQEALKRRAVPLPN